MILLFLTVLGVCAVLWKYSRDPEIGWAWWVALMLIYPTEVRFHLPGSLPELTMHRILLGLGLCLLLLNRDQNGSCARAPLMKVFTFMAVAQFFSMLLATEKLASLKDWLGFVIEQFLFTWMVWTSLSSRRGIRLMLWSVAAAILVVGCIAIVERYRDVNLAAHFIPEMKDDGRTITATFRHRIQYGYFMAMGLPLMLALAALSSGLARRSAWIGALLAMGGSYLSFSRGPWLGAALGGAFLALVGGQRMRRALTLIGVLAVLVLLSRPGVYDTLERLYEHSKTTDTHKGRSFYYRLELWGVAWKMLSTSVERTAFGYGGGSLESMDLSAAFNYGGYASLGFTSWDSELAAMLMKFGLVGMLAAVLLFGSAGIRLLRALRWNWGDDRILIAGCAGTFGVFLFSMTNVAIFNPQLRFLFWLAVVLGLKHAWFVSQEADSAMPDEFDSSNLPVTPDVTGQSQDQVLKY